MGSNTVESFTTISDSNNPNAASFKRTRNHVVFRLLCHASRIGAFIGKAGFAIKALQQLTESRIRVDDAPQECPERVIVVIIKLDGEVEGDVAKAKEALLKVFERILEVAAAESEGKEGNEVGDRGVVSCRMLVNGGQAGAIIGKGGKVVEKIRVDTGCRIRVLCDNLPVCVKPSDEIIEIQGTASSVKKALIAVAGRLQDGPPPERTKMMGTKPNEVFQHETSAVPHEGTRPNEVLQHETSAVPHEGLSDRTKMMGTRPNEVFQHETSAVPHEGLSDRTKMMGTRPNEVFQHETSAVPHEGLSDRTKMMGTRPNEVFQHETSAVPHEGLSDRTKMMGTRPNEVFQHETSAVPHEGLSDRTKMMGTRPNEVVKHETSAVPHEGLSDRTKMMGTRPNEVFQHETSAVPHEGLSDRTKMMGTRPNEVFQHETSAVPHEGLSDLNMGSSTSPIRSNDTGSKVHPLSAETNRISALDPEALQQEVTFRILCSGDRIGSVIGKGGSIVKTLQNETGATISVGPQVFECEDRLITVTALENPESRFSPAQKAVVLIFCRSIDGSVEEVLDSRPYKGSSVIARLVVPSNQVGVLLGKEGSIVSEIRKATWTNIRVIGNGQVPKCASYNDQVVQISGDFQNVQDALYKATSRLRDHLFALTQNSGGTGPYRRLRDSVPLSLGGQPVVGANHDFNVHSLSQSINHLTLSRNLDRSSARGVWAPKTVGGIRFGFSDDVNRRWTPHKGGLELASGIKTSFVTNTTVELTVPNNIIGSVYGENGSNLNQLRQISGAKVTVHEAHPGTSNSTTIVLSGSPDETQAAQSLLQAFIINGSS